MKVAIITGTSSGLGKAFAQALLDLGWKVYGISRREAPELMAHSNFRQIIMDLAKPLDKQLLTKEIQEKKIDLLVNNAGVCITGPADQWDEAAYNNTFRIQYTTPMELLSYFVNMLKDGQIINILSDAAVLGWESFGLFGASKAALLLHSKSYAKEHPEIKLLNIHPSSVDTPMTDTVSQEAIAERHNFMEVQEIVGLFLQAITGVLSLPTGSSIFAHNQWEAPDLRELGSNIYLYNVESKSLIKL